MDVCQEEGIGVLSNMRSVESYAARPSVCVFTYLSPYPLLSLKKKIPSPFSRFHPPNFSKLIDHFLRYTTPHPLYVVSHEERRGHDPCIFDLCHQFPHVVTTQDAASFWQKTSCPQRHTSRTTIRTHEDGRSLGKVGVEPWRE